MEDHRRRDLTGADIKRIAIVSMVVDHIGRELITLGMLQMVFRTVGRLAFPLFCFLLVEGFFHTGDRKAYGKRLLLFAFLSEIPFDLFFGGTLFFPGAQNVFFTLFLGLCMLERIHRAETAEWEVLYLLLFGAAAWILKCDYDAGGMLLIAMLYLYRRRRCSILLPALAAVLLSMEYFGAAALAVIPIWFYGGTRGKQAGRPLYYLFYPIHLLVFYGLSCMR